MTAVFDRTHMNWRARQEISPLQYDCGWCDNRVSSSSGYIVGEGTTGTGKQRAAIYICPHCCGPTFVDLKGKHVPDMAFGSEVGHLPQDVSELYNEARHCTSNGAYTATVMLCRKLLMHIAVEQEAEDGRSFEYYVNYLAEKGFVPPNGRHWVDHIRQKGNEANHEIVIMNVEDARDLIQFLEMLLRFIYEFPQLIPQKPKA